MSSSSSAALQRWLFPVVLCCLVVAAGAARAQTARTPARNAADGVTQEILSFNSADGVSLPGVLTLPPTGNPGAGPIILHLPDGPGGGPLRAADTARGVARGLAQLGYPSLSIETRHTMQYSFTRFDEAFADVKGAIDLMTARGFSAVILSGDGLGSLLAVRYAAEAGDARVKAVIAYAPSVDLAAAWRAKVGEEIYTRTVEQATKSEGSKSEGQGGFIDLGDGLIFTPAVFLDWYGPNAKTSMTASLPGVEKPLLLSAGVDDRTVPAGRLQQLAGLAANAKKVVTKTYPRVGHDLSAARDAVVTDTARWLVDLNLIPLPRVITTVVDTTAADGTPLSGILYTPAVLPPASSRRPTFMLVHGWNGDVMRSTTHLLGQRLAQHGYTALAVRTRGSGFRGTVSGKLEDIPQDIAAWANVLTARGAARIIGVGHTLGGLWLSTYLSQSQDKRFKAAIYLSPPRDLPSHARRGMGEEAYNRAVQEAEAAVKAGHGNTHLINVPFAQVSYDEDPRQPMALSQGTASGFTYYYADAFLSYWGPDSLAMHRERAAELKIPVLAIGGSRDAMMQGGWLLQFIKSAGGPSASIFYGGPNGATASFDGYDSRIEEDIAGWAEKLP